MVLRIFAMQRFGSKVVFFGIVIEHDDDDDDDIEGRKLKPVNEEFYGDASQGFEVKVSSGMACHNLKVKLQSRPQKTATLYLLFDLLGNTLCFYVQIELIHF